jgi:hypothetical protein
MPETIPPYRNYVVDQIDQVPIWDYDMACLAELNDDLILLEWDIVVAHHDLVNFIQHARMSPDRVQVAPYVLYPISTDLDGPVWAHRNMIHEVPLQLSWVDFGESTCDLFSTGMIYIPQKILRDCVDDVDHIAWQKNLTDSKLAFWHYHKVGKPVPIHWDIRPIHLHYSVEDVYNARGIERTR